MIVLLLGFFHIIFDKVRTDYIPELQGQINETNTSLTANVNSTISSVWQYFLFIAVIGIIAWVFIQAQTEKTCPYE